MLNLGQLSGLYPLKLCIFVYFISIIICLFPFLCAKAVISFVIYLLICYYVLYINVFIVSRIKKITFALELALDRCHDVTFSTIKIDRCR